MFSVIPDISILSRFLKRIYKGFVSSLLFNFQDTNAIMSRHYCVKESLRGTSSAISLARNRYPFVFVCNIFDRLPSRECLSIISHLSPFVKPFSNLFSICFSALLGRLIYIIIFLSLCQGGFRSFSRFHIFSQQVHRHFVKIAFQGGKALKKAPPPAGGDAFWNSVFFVQVGYVFLI